MNKAKWVRPEVDTGDQWDCRHCGRSFYLLDREDAGPLPATMLERDDDGWGEDYTVCPHCHKET